MTAPPVSRYQFGYWDVDGSPAGGNPLTVNMGMVHIAKAHYSQITQQVHDAAVSNVTVPKNVTGQGVMLHVNVTLANHGEYSETLNITVYANQTVATTLANITLANGNSIIAVLSWNTTGLAYGNYTISAYVWPVTEEMNTADNNMTGGWMIVTMPGDIDGNFRVQLQDLVLLAQAYGSRLGDANWNPNADLDGTTL